MQELQLRKYTKADEETIRWLLEECRYILNYDKEVELFLLRQLEKVITSLRE